MPQRTQAESQRIQKASNRAAAITMLGLVVVVGTLGYSAWKLHQLDAEIQTKQTEFGELEREVQVAQSRIDAADARKKELEASNKQLQQKITKNQELNERLEKRNEFLVGYADTFSEQFEELKRQFGSVYEIAAKSSDGDREIREMIARAPIETVVEPRATAEPLPDREGSYKFTLSVDSPEGRRGEIERVKYFFDHPSFLKKEYDSTDAQNDFQVSYTGWGALRQVRITLVLKKGENRHLAFDMADAINRSDERLGDGERIPTKGQEKIPTKAQKKIPIKGQEKIPVKGQEKIPVKGQEKIPVKGQEKIPVKGAASLP